MRPPPCGSLESRSWPLMSCEAIYTYSIYPHTPNSLAGTTGWRTYSRGLNLKLETLYWKYAIFLSTHQKKQHAALQQASLPHLWVQLPLGRDRRGIQIYIIMQRLKLYVSWEKIQNRFSIYWTSYSHSLLLQKQDPLCEISLSILGTYSSSRIYRY